MAFQDDVKQARQRMSLQMWVILLVLITCQMPLNGQTIDTISVLPPVACSGVLRNLNAIADNDTINWYTSISDTIMLGQSLSGIDFPVYPEHTTAYYAELSPCQPTDSAVFSYTGAVQVFTVPVGVTYLAVDMSGAQGGTDYLYFVGNGELGERIQGVYPVTPGQVLEIYVGEQPTSCNGGWNGGGDAYCGNNFYGGGGASDIRTGGSSLSDRILVAGGGHGAFYWGGTGGGPGFADSAALAVHFTPLFRSGHGQVKIYWSLSRVAVPVYVSPTLNVSVTISADLNGICAGNQVTYSTSIINGGESPVIQWFVNGIPVGENTLSYSYQPDSADIVRCSVISSEACTAAVPVFSNEISMIVYQQTSFVNQIYCWSGTDICTGSGLGIHSGMGPWSRPCVPYTMQWIRDGVPLSGQNTEWLYISSATISDSGNYAFVVSNLLGNDTSNVIHMNVHPIPEPGTIDVQLLATPEVLVSYTGDTIASNLYNWNFSGGEIVSGSGRGPFVISYQDGNYRNVSLSVSNGFCTSPTFYSNTFKIELFNRLDQNLPNFIFGRSEWGDYNNDGLLDILSTGDGFTEIIKNCGSDSFAIVNSNFPHIGYSTCKWLDYNNDNQLDFIVSGFDSVNLITKLYKNTGNGTFEESGQYFPGVKSGTLACFDYNNDGLTDILISGEDSTGLPITSVFRNSDNFVFTEDSSGIKPLQYSAIDFADYNKDGYMDFLINGRDSAGPATKLYKNNHGAFVEVPTSIINTWSGDIAWGDYNDDGYPDLVISGYNQLPRFSGDNQCIDRTDAVTLNLYRNNGDESFSLIADWHNKYAFFSSDLEWGDINNDGKLDLFTTGYAGNHSCYIGIGGGGGASPDIYAQGRQAVIVHQNEGNGIFTDMCLDIPRAYFLYSLGNWTFYMPAPDRSCNSLSIAPGDYNTDGKLDILRGGSGLVPSENLDFRSAVYENMLPAGNLPPSDPGNLQSIVNMDTVRLAWNHSTDDLTPQSGLTYNLRIGTVPGGNNIMSSQSNAAGWRKVACPGNVNQDTVWHLSNLDPGIYYWSVQAIDNAFNGGAMAPEQTFSIDLGVPANMTVPDDTIASGESTCYNALQTLTAGGAGGRFNVNSGGDVTMIAGQNIVFLPAVQVETGGHLHGYITKTNAYCFSQVLYMSDFLSTPDPDLITNKKLSADAGNKGQIKVFPNPVSENMTLSFENLQLAGPCKIILYNMFGEMVFSQDLSEAEKTVIPMADYSPGIYLLHAGFVNFTKTLKVIRQ